MAKNMTFMDEAKWKEIRELFEGEHANAIAAWSLECAKAGINAGRNGIIKSSMIAAVGAGLAAGALFGIQRLVGKRIKKLKESKNVET